MVNCSGLDLLFVAGILGQFASQLGAFAGSDHPTDDVAAEDIENHLDKN